MKYCSSLEKRGGAERHSRYSRCDRDIRLGGTRGDLAEQDRSFNLCQRKSGQEEAYSRQSR